MKTIKNVTKLLELLRDNFANIKLQPVFIDSRVHRTLSGLSKRMFIQRNFQKL